MSDTPDCIHVVALIVPKPGKRNEVRNVLLELREATRREEGCIQYDLLEETNNPTDFTFVERWESREALDAHF
jgi:quinol monooxygenase YgiN